MAEITNNNRKLIEKALDETVDVILEEIGMKAEAYAAMKAPHDTGLLRNSITHAIAGSAPDKTSYQADSGGRSGAYSGTAPASEEPAVYIGTNVEYAAYVELGTQKTASQPFIRPAIENHRDEYRAIVLKHLNNS